MAQTILTVVVEVQPPSSPRLIQLISDFDAQQEPALPDEQKFDKLRSAIPLLHFLSMTVFPDEQYDPLFVLEANFDGPPGPFWAQIEATMGEILREIFRCCKPPLDSRKRLFIEVTKENSRVPVAPLLEACTVWPAVYHQGNRGLDRSRIITEGKIFDSIQTLLGKNQAMFYGITATQVHQKLRTLLLPSFPCLNDDAIPRVSRRERVADALRLLGFVVLLIAALILPVTALAHLIEPEAALPVLLIAIGFFILKTPKICRTLGEILNAPRFFKVVAIIGWAILISGLLSIADGVLTDRFGKLLPEWFDSFSFFTVGLLVTLRGLLYWLHWLECRDSSNDAPKLDKDVMDAMARREDKIAQNHMCSVVHVKPGILRAILLRVGLVGLGLWLRYKRRDGYLGSMRTIHFAHWALVNNGSRLMFLSNFDGSWESYLDDFIEKAHTGLTLAWSSGVGFPPTRFLVGDGAVNGRKFKLWARHSMMESKVWFSAYKEYTVNQIERHARVANGLRYSTLSDMEAKGWALDL